MKHIKFLALILIIVLVAACEKAEDITGDSSLKIINDCSVSLKIYFDDSYIGRVSSDEDETWSVPSGNHKITAKSSFHDDFEGFFNFTTGQTRVIRLELEFDKSSIIQMPVLE